MIADASRAASLRARRQTVPERRSRAVGGWERCGAQSQCLRTKEQIVMWKPRPEDNSPTSTNQPSRSAPASVAPTMMAPPKEQPKPSAASNDRSYLAHIGKSVLIRGETTGNEDLYLDG